MGITHAKGRNPDSCADVTFDISSPVQPRCECRASNTITRSLRECVAMGSTLRGFNFGVAAPSNLDVQLTLGLPPS